MSDSIVTATPVLSLRCVDCNQPKLTATWNPEHDVYVVESHHQTIHGWVSVVESEHRHRRVPADITRSCAGSGAEIRLT